MESPVKWIGGKRKEIKYFEKYIPNFYEYVEPFIGGGALYWYLEPDYAIINDINENLMNFYKILRDNYEILTNNMNSYINSRDFYYKIVDKLNSGSYKDETELAEIFYYLNKTSFSGKWRVNSKNKFNSAFGYYNKDNYKNLNSKYCDLLNRTRIYCKDFRLVMEEYKDNPNAFIFLDPPYLGCDILFTDNQDFTDIYLYIHNYIKRCKCKVMLIVKETEDINILFHDYIIDSYEVKYNCNSKTKRIHKHLIITNYIKTF